MVHKKTILVAVGSIGQIDNYFMNLSICFSIIFCMRLLRMLNGGEWTEELLRVFIVKESFILIMIAFLKRLMM